MLSAGGVLVYKKIMEYQPQKVTCQNAKLGSKYCEGEFVVEPEDFVFYEKIKVPPPTFCPGCRIVRRFNFRNERYLFRKPDARDGREIFSAFSKDSFVKIYENNYWFSDNWNRLATGKDYNFSINFFNQLFELMNNAPILAKSVHNLYNSEYCNEAGQLKNCYLCFNIDFSEDSFYLRKTRNIKNSADLYECENCEYCYENILVDKSYRVFYSQNCESCVDVWFSKNLRNCTNCFGCVNLSNKSYCLFNEQLNKEEYEEKLKNINTGSYTTILELKNKIKDFWLKFPTRYINGFKNINSTGDRIWNSKDLKDCYYVKDSIGLKYCQDIWTKTSDCYDYSVWGDGAEKVYECMTCGGGVNNLKFCFNCYENCQNLEYCVYCLGCNDCFGCVGLYKKQYCILNKQYSKEEYFEMVEKIKKHMDEMPYIDKKGRVYKYGEFFPIELSPYSYNESLAQDFFPLDKTDIKSNGFKYRDLPIRNFLISKKSDDLFDNISNINDQILNEVLECKKCNLAYKIIDAELKFYKRFNIPIPRKCSDCRFVERFTNITPPKFWKRSCMNNNCNNTFITNYHPDRPEIVYCEKCYQQEVI